MNLKQLSEVVYSFYNNGRASSASHKFAIQDIEQWVLFALGAQLRQKAYEGRDTDEGTDFIGAMLDTKDYELSTADVKAMRRAVVGGEVVRLPRNTDIINVYPVGGGCKEDLGAEITQVMPGEENYYIGNPDLTFFMFFVQKGRGINTYNVPACVSKISVERIYVSEDLDISLDIAYLIAAQVLKDTLGINVVNPVSDNPVDPNRNELRYQLEQKNAKM